jgi:hypothetical protein
MDADMDFEQGGDALAIFQEAFNAQQRAPPTINNDRKMLYVHPLPPLIPLIPFNLNVFDRLSLSQRSRLCSGLHRQPGILHFVRDKKHPAHLREHLSIGQATIPRGPARRPRRLSRSPTAGPHLHHTQFWFFVRY